ncbi:MAG TPA: serine hydrolase domain-containing protein [Terriglobia bacterium]|nr:serine hydrolase domain-containing protein [Terriglobia bacterium]
MNLGVRAVAVSAAGKFVVIESNAQSTASSYAGVFTHLDTFIEQYMRDMNSPGMTLVMADRDGVQRVATYGFSDVDSKIGVRPDEFFQIGSISKSFVANCLLQLRQEGKLDLNKPVTEYLPWFRIESAFEPITVHHLLTHTSGLPGNSPLFLSDPSQKHRAAYAPGQIFHYCNMAYVALGHLLWTLDKRPLPDVLRKRIFEPLGMTQSEPSITLDIRPKTARNYCVFQNDRPYSRHGRISEAPAIVLTDGSGCVSSTPRDMGLYIQMIANHGQGPGTRLLSEESFDLFSKAHVKAEEFGPTASYGYGIAVDTLDGHRIVRHTGGMVSFASALQVDIDEGVGAFASINAMQGYRPNPVVQYSIQLMRAARGKKPLPSMPPSNSPTEIENAADYAGTYQCDDGRKLELVAESQQLSLLHEGKRIALEGLGTDTFIVGDPAFERFPLVFSRADAKDPKSSVVDAGWGNDWYTNSKYKGPAKLEFPAEWKSYLGHYRNESPWIGSFHIVVRKGKLMADGVVPLEAGDGGLFYFRDEPQSPEWIRFHDIVNGVAMRLKFSGEDMWRVMAD